MEENADDARWMHVALDMARRAALRGEVPVGAVVVHGGRCIAKAHNLREATQDPTGHAEVQALREASRVRGTWRLDDCQLYVTLEPCVMCAGALLQSRVARVVYGCDDPKAGALHSLFALAEDARLNHRYPFARGVLSQECSTLLTNFFRDIRSGQRSRSAR